MIRFALKSCLALGLLALVLPLGQGSDSELPRVDVFGLLSGVQEAAADIGGFCERAPRACVAGRELAAFAGERIETGARIGYAYIENAFVPASPAETVAGAGEARPDPVTTGTVGELPAPRPYMPPRPALEAMEVSAPLRHETPLHTVAIPTPAPRG